MNSSDKRLFELLDDYARKRHQCFLAEMFLNSEGSEYVLCFRPRGGSKSANQYSCRYLNIALVAGRAAGKAAALFPSMTQMLDDSLSGLSEFE